ncbi:MAG: flagellar biosynthesis protein FlhB [Gammaproteobacteria bacterium]
MAESDSGQDRTEEATPKRKADARKKGQLPRSRELTTLSMLLIAAITLWAMGGYMLGKFNAIMHIGLSVERAQLLNPYIVIQRLTMAISQGFSLLLPFFIVMLVTAFFSPLALGGWSFSTESLGFKFNKLNPLTGFKRMVSPQALMELLKSLAKFILIGCVGVSLLWHYAPEILGLGGESIENAISHGGHILVKSFLILSATLILVAGIDVPFQLWTNNKKMRMTKQEVRDEHKEIDGRPEVKAKIKALQREVSQRRMIENIPTADVVITNPTHFAVALRYDAENMSEPVVVAKGVELIASHIRTVAVANGVPLFEAPPLARALYYSTDIDQPVPGGLYLAVAQVLAYIYQLKSAGKTGEVKPERPNNLDVPSEYYQGRKTDD